MEKGREREEGRDGGMENGMEREGCRVMERRGMMEGEMITPVYSLRFYIYPKPHRC